MSKSKVATKTVQEDGSVEFAFANQEKRTVKIQDFPKHIVSKIIGYGLSQKFGDSYAGASGDPEKAVEMFDNLLGKLTGEDAQWISKRSGGGSAKRPTLIVEAVARYKDCDIEAAIELVESLDKDQLAAVRGTVVMQEHIANIKAERARAKAEAAKGDESDALSVL